MEDESYYINDFNVYRSKQQACAVDRGIKAGDGSLPAKLNLFLYSKYSSSQNYYYTKEVNNILGGSKDATAIEFIDMMAYHEEEDTLKRLYTIGEYPQKIALLSEYYKYHEDVPRLFMMPVATVVHNYYDKKRRINYIKITRQLREENPEMTDSKELSNLNIHDSDTSLSQDNNETLPKSLCKLLPDDMSPRQAIDLDETSNRKERLTTSLTMHELTDVLAGIFKKSGKLMEKRKIKGKVLKYSNLDSESSISLHLGDLPQWETKHLQDGDISNEQGFGKRLFLSNKVNRQSAAKPKVKVNPETTKHQRQERKKSCNEPQPGAFKKKKEAVLEFKGSKLSQLKSEEFLTKIGDKQVNRKKSTKKALNPKCIVSTSKPKDQKCDKKKVSHFNIHNLNININFNDTNKSNKLASNKKTGSVGYTYKPEIVPNNVISDSPSYSLLKHNKVESQREVQPRGRSINFAHLRNCNGSNEQTLNTRTLDRNLKLGDFSSKWKDTEGLLNLTNLRKSFKNRPSFATFYMNKQLNPFQSFKSTEFFKSKDKTREKFNKGIDVYKAKLAKASSPTIKNNQKPTREVSGDVKVSQRRQKSNANQPNKNAQLKLFMSQDYKENRFKASTAGKSTKNGKSVKVSQKDKSPIDKQKHTLKNLLESGGLYNNKFSTLGASFKGRIDDGTANRQFNTVTNAHVFQAKKSKSNNKIKANIENSLKGQLIRKTHEKGFADEFEGIRTEHEEEASTHS